MDKVSVENIGKLVRRTRKSLGLTQSELAMVSDTGKRFIGELENGKSSCQLGKALQVIESLGITIQFSLPEEVVVDEHE